jgi:hypothetical protein
VFFVPFVVKEQRPDFYSQGRKGTQRKTRNAFLCGEYPPAFQRRAVSPPMNNLLGYRS